VDTDRLMARRLPKAQAGRKVVRPKPPPLKFALPGLPPIGTKIVTNSGVRLVASLPNRPPQRRKPTHVAASKKAPIKAPLKPAGRAGKSTAATIPPRAHVRAPAPARTVGAGQPPRRPAPAAKKPRPKSRVVQGEAMPAPGLSDQDILQQLLAPQYMQIDQAEARQAQLEQQRTSMIQALTNEMMGKLGGIAPQVQADYQRAGDTNLALAREGRDALAAASPNPQMQADLAAVNAPPEQRQLIADQAKNVFEGGGAVLFGQQGLIPGQELAARGAAQTAYSRNLTGIAGLQGMQALRSFFADATAARQGLTDQRMQVAARGPSLLMDLQNTRSSQAAKDRALGLEEYALGLRTRAQTFSEGVTKVKLNQAGARLAQGDTSLKLRALQQDRQWNATLRGLDIREGGLKLRAAETQNRLNNKGFTSSQVSQFQKRAGKLASDAWNGVPVREGGEIVGYNHLTYQRAMSEMLAQGIPLTVAQRALNTYWSQPGLVAAFEKGEDGRRLGGAGRPMMSYQQRQQAAKKKPKKRRR
jgi:hypothetical protein